MPRFAICIAFVALTTSLLLAGRASAAAGNPCSSSAINGGTAVLEGAVWRMEVREDEVAFIGPSIHDRVNHNWTHDAKTNYRWTSVAMPVDAGTSTRLMTISAVAIGKGVPLLERGDIVDVAVLQGLDYSKGRASAILRRVCAARDDGCLNKLRRTQEGRVSGMEEKGGDHVASYRKFSPPLANLSRSAPVVGCRQKMAAVRP